MNIKTEPLSDKEAAELEDCLPAVRRSVRVKNSLFDFSLIKPRRKRKANSEGIEGKSDGELTVPPASVKIEKSPLDIPVDDGGSPFLITSKHRDGRELDELTRSTESTLTAHTEGSVESLTEDDPVYLEHSYCTNPKRQVMSHPEEEDKEKEIVESIEPVGPKEAVEFQPIVDLSTLAVYRAFIDHNYSTITPSAIVEAIMLKHNYICSEHALQDFPVEKGTFEQTSPRGIFQDPHQRIKTEAAPDCQDSQIQSISGVTPISKKGKKRKLPTEGLLINPELRSPPTSNNDADEKTPPISTPPPPKKLVITQKVIPAKESPKKNVKSSAAANSSVVKKVKAEERESRPPKLKIEIKLKKRKRRKNATGWPTKKSQPAGKSTDKKPKKLTASKKDVTKVKKEKSSRDSSCTRSVAKDPKEEFVQAGVVLSIGETVKRRVRASAAPGQRKPVQKNATEKKPNMRAKSLKKSRLPSKMIRPGRGTQKRGSHIGHDGESNECVEEKAKGETEKVLKLGISGGGEELGDIAQTSEPISGSQINLGEKIKLRVTSLFNCASKGESPKSDKDQQDTEDTRSVVDQGKESTESGSEGGMPNKKDASAVLKKKSQKVAWLATKCRGRGRSSNESPDAPKSVYGKRKLRLRRKVANPSPSTDRIGESDVEKCGGEDCTCSFPVVIIKQEPIDAVIPSGPSLAAGNQQVENSFVEFRSAGDVQGRTSTRLQIEQQDKMPCCRVSSSSMRLSENSPNLVPKSETLPRNTCSDTPSESSQSKNECELDDFNRLRCLETFEDIPNDISSSFLSIKTNPEHLWSPNLSETIRQTVMSETENVRAKNYSFQAADFSFDKPNPCHAVAAGCSSPPSTHQEIVTANRPADSCQNGAKVHHIIRPSIVPEACVRFESSDPLESNSPGYISSNALGPHENPCRMLKAELNTEQIEFDGHSQEVENPADTTASLVDVNGVVKSVDRATVEKNEGTPLPRVDGVASISDFPNDENRDGKESKSDCISEAAGDGTEWRVTTSNSESKSADDIGSDDCFSLNEDHNQRSVSGENMPEGSDGEDRPAPKSNQNNQTFDDHRSEVGGSFRDIPTPSIGDVNIRMNSDHSERADAGLQLEPPTSNPECSAPDKLRSDDARCSPKDYLNPTATDLPKGNVSEFYCSGNEQLPPTSRPESESADNLRSDDINCSPSNGVIMSSKDYLLKGSSVGRRNITSCTVPLFDSRVLASSHQSVDSAHQLSPEPASTPTSDTNITKCDTNRVSSSTTHSQGRSDPSKYVKTVDRLDNCEDGNATMDLDGLLKLRRELARSKREKRRKRYVRQCRLLKLLRWRRMRYSDLKSFFENGFMTKSKSAKSVGVSSSQSKLCTDKECSTKVVGEEVPTQGSNLEKTKDNRSDARNSPILGVIKAVPKSASSDNQIVNDMAPNRDPSQSYLGSICVSEDEEENNCKAPINPPLRRYSCTPRILRRSKVIRNPNVISCHQASTNLMDHRQTAPESYHSTSSTDASSACCLVLDEGEMVLAMNGQEQVGRTTDDSESSERPGLDRATSAEVLPICPQISSKVSSEIQCTPGAEECHPNDSIQPDTAAVSVKGQPLQNPQGSVSRDNEPDLESVVTKRNESSAAGVHVSGFVGQIGTTMPEVVEHTGTVPVRNRIEGEGVQHHIKPSKRLNVLIPVGRGLQSLPSTPQSKCTGKEGVQTSPQPNLILAGAPKDTISTVCEDSSDSDFSIVDPYGSDSDDHTTDLQQPSHKPNSDANSVVSLPPVEALVITTPKISAASVVRVNSSMNSTCEQVPSQDCVEITEKRDTQCNPVRKLPPSQKSNKSDGDMSDTLTSLSEPVTISPSITSKPLRKSVIVDNRTKGIKVLRPRDERSPENDSSVLEQDPLKILPTSYSAMALGGSNLTEARTEVPISRGDTGAQGIRTETEQHPLESFSSNSASELRKSIVGNARTEIPMYRSVTCAAESRTKEPKPDPPKVIETQLSNSGFRQPPSSSQGFGWTGNRCSGPTSARLISQGNTSAANPPWGTIVLGSTNRKLVFHPINGISDNGNCKSPHDPAQALEKLHLRDSEESLSKPQGSPQNSASGFDAPTSVHTNLLPKIVSVQGGFRSFLPLSTISAASLTERSNTINCKQIVKTFGMKVNHPSSDTSYQRNHSTVVSRDQRSSADHLYCKKPLKPKTGSKFQNESNDDSNDEEFVPGKRKGRKKRLRKSGNRPGKEFRDAKPSTKGYPKPNDGLPDVSEFEESLHHRSLLEGDRQWANPIIHQPPEKDPLEITDEGSEFLMDPLGGFPLSRDVTKNGITWRSDPKSSGLPENNRLNLEGGCEPTCQNEEQRGGGFRGSRATSKFPSDPGPQVANGPSINRVYRMIAPKAANFPPSEEFYRNRKSWIERPPAESRLPEEPSNLSSKPFQMHLNSSQPDSASLPHIGRIPRLPDTTTTVDGCRTSSPVEPSYDEDDLPVGDEESDFWKNREYIPPPEIARLYHRIHRRLCGAPPSRARRLMYRKGGRPPFSYVELAAMAIELEPLKSIRFSGICSFVVEHFKYYRCSQAKHWKGNFRTTIGESKYFYADRVGFNVFYSFRQQYRLPTDPVVFEATEEVHTESDVDPDEEVAKDALPEEEPDPLVPICEYSDEEIETTQEALVDHVDEFLSLGSHNGVTSACELPPGEVVTHSPDGVVPLPNERLPDDQLTYNCTFCPAKFLSSQDAADHSLNHPEATKNCPICDFTSPDEIQLLWHVNSMH